MKGFFPRSRRMGQRKGLFRTAFRAAALTVLLMFQPVPAEAGEDLLSAVGLILEPKFTSPDQFQEIAGAQETLLVAARQTSSGSAQILSAREWKAASLEWPQVLAAGRARAGRLEQTLHVEWHRDRRKVYQYAVIESQDPFLSSVIYSPDFLKHFQEYLGNEILVVVPDRFSVYVFPRYGNTLDDYGPGLVQRHKEALFKVSLEVFLIEPGKEPRVIGKIGQ